MTAKQPGPQGVSVGYHWVNNDPVLVDTGSCHHDLRCGQRSSRRWPARHGGRYSGNSTERMLTQAQADPPVAGHGPQRNPVVVFFSLEPDDL